MFVATTRHTARFGSDEEAAIHNELVQENQNDVRMETKSVSDEYVQSSEDSPDFRNIPQRKQSYGGIKRNQIYKETSFAELGEVKVPRVKKNRRETDKRRKNNEADENQQDVQLLMKSLALEGLQ